MKRFLCYFFCTLGVIFFLILLFLGYLYVTDAYGIRTIITASRTAVPTALPVQGSISTETSPNDGKAVSEDRNPALSPAQENALSAVGIDPAQVPSKFTPEQEACFVRVLGAARVEAIKAGDTPTAVEFVKAKECL